MSRQRARATVGSTGPNAERTITESAEREMDDPEGNLVIVEKCACREAIRLPERSEPRRGRKGPRSDMRVNGTFRIGSTVGPVLPTY